MLKGEKKGLFFPAITSFINLEKGVGFLFPDWGEKGDREENGQRKKFGRGERLDYLYHIF